jgi:Amt family ammonium transporter
MKSLRMISPRLVGTCTLLTLIAMALPAAAEELDSGDTAWMLTSTALVLFMTIPGLALFYGGLVRAKNVLSVLMQCFALTCLTTLLWIAYGYSLAFDTTGMVGGETNLHSFVGGFKLDFAGGTVVHINAGIAALVAALMLGKRQGYL